MVDMARGFISKCTLSEKLPYCYLFPRELNFAKMEEANFARLNFAKIVQMPIRINKQVVSESAKWMLLQGTKQ